MAATMGLQPSDACWDMGPQQTMVKSCEIAHFQATLEQPDGLQDSGLLVVSFASSGHKEEDETLKERRSQQKACIVSALKL